MSGPKTSHLTIEQQVQLRLMAANKSTASAFAEARSRIEKARDGVNSLARSLNSLGDASRADAVVKSVDAKMAKTSHAFEELRAECQAMRSLTSPDEIDAMAKRISQKIVALSNETVAWLEGQDSELRGALRKAERSSEASEFAAMLRDVLSEERAKASLEGEGVQMEARREQATASPSTTLAWKDVANEVGEASLRFSALMARPEYIASEGAAVLVRHGALFLEAVERCSDDATQEEIAAARNAARTMLELLPRYEREAEALRDVRSQIDALEGGVPSAFCSVDEAEAFLAELKEARSEAVRQDYIRSCIDEVMSRHGYDIARSVTLNRASLGENMVYGSRDDSAGVHMFVNDQGDMMMEAVGVGDVSSIPEGADVDISRVEDASTADALVEPQEAFCSVYAQIEEELAKYGIHVDTVHRCPPSREYSKQLSVLRDDGRAAQESLAKAARTREASRRRRAAGKREHAL